MNWSNWSKRSAYLLVQADWRAGEKLWRDVQKWDETIGTWLVAGPWDLVVWVDANGWEDVYEKAVWLRAQKGVKATSTHFVYKGTKSAQWWWDQPVGNWVFARGPRLNGELEDVHKYSHVVSATSVPGDWDYMVWFGGKKWEDVWSQVGDMNKAGWRTQTLVPMKSWWNKDWKRAWWSRAHHAAAA